MSRESGLDIVCFPFPLGGFIAGKWVLTGGPADWLSHIKEASIVLTDSFHGCALSIIFNKEFRVFPTGTVTRITNLLNVFDLKDCLVEKGTTVKRDSTVNWAPVNVRLSALREASIETLIRSLE